MSKRSGYLELHIAAVDLAALLKGNKINAIRLLRAATGCSLRDAKNTVDSIMVAHYTRAAEQKRLNEASVAMLPKLERKGK